MASRKLELGRFRVGDTGAGAEEEARGSSVAEVCWNILRELGNLGQGGLLSFGQR